MSKVRLNIRLKLTPITSPSFGLYQGTVTLFIDDKPIKSEICKGKTPDVVRRKMEKVLKEMKKYRSDEELIEPEDDPYDILFT